jgi:hypothetical protein
MSWSEYGGMTIEAKPDMYRRFVRTFRNDAAPGAEVRVAYHPANTGVEDLDWEPESITVMVTTEFCLGSGDKSWSEKQEGWASLIGYDSDKIAEEVSERLVGRFSPAWINWDGLSQELPDPAWGRLG